MTKVHGLASLQVYDPVKNANVTDISCVFVLKKGKYIPLGMLHVDGNNDSFLKRIENGENFTVQNILGIFKTGKLRFDNGDPVQSNHDFFVIDKHAYASKDPATATKLRNIYEDSTEVGKLSTTNSYIKIDLGGTSPIRYVKKSEIVLLDKDGNVDQSLLDIIRNLSVSSTIADIFKEAKGKKWYYKDKNTPIEELFLAQEYTHVATEEVENNKIVAKGVLATDITLPTGRTIAKNDGKKYTHSDPARVDLDVVITPDSKTEPTVKGMTKAPTFKVTSYKPDANGTYIKVRLKGTNDSIIINAESFISSVSAGVTLTLDGSVTTEPLTEDEAGIRYSPNLTLQPSKATAITDKTYLRLSDGRYIKEDTHIQPISYKQATGNVKVSAYAVNIAGIWKIVDASNVNIDSATKKFKLGDEEYDSQDTNQCIALERCNFDINARFIQTQTGQVANACEDFDGLSLSEKYTKLEETRKAFVASYKKGDYTVGTYYDACRVPKAFGTTTLTATNLVAYAVEIDGKWKIVDKSQAVYDASASKLTVDGKDYSTAWRGVKPLTEVGFSDASKVEFIQTGFGQIANACEDLNGKTEAEKKAKIEEIKNKHTGLFAISQERYEYTNDVVVDDVSTVTSTLEKTYKKESKFMYSNDGTLKMESGAGFKAKTTKAIGKLEGWSLGTAFAAINLLSILSPAAGIAVAIAAGVVAIFGPAVVATIVAIRNKPVTDDMVTEQQKHASKCINQKLEFTYEYLNELVESKQCTDDMIMSRVDAIMSNIGVLSASTYDDSCKLVNGEIKITPQNAHRVSELNKEIRKALTEEYKTRSRWERFKTRINPKNWFKKRSNLELQLIDEEIRKEAYRLIEKYNSLCTTKDEKIKEYKKLSTKELENLVKTKVSTKVADISHFEDLVSNDPSKSKRAEIDGITNEIFAKYEHPSERPEHADKEILETRANNLKIYLIVKNALTDKSVIAFDYESGLILVGNQKLVKVGEHDFKLENLTKAEEKKLVSAKKFYKSASTVATDVSETITNEAKRAHTVINEEKVNKPDERSIEVEIINYVEVENNKKLINDFSADITDLAGCANISTDLKFTGNVNKVQDAIVGNEIPEVVKEAIVALNKAKDLYESQKEQVKKEGKEALFLGDSSAGIISVDDVLTAYNTVKTSTLQNAHNKYKAEVAPASGGSGAGAKKNNKKADKIAAEGKILSLLNNKTKRKALVDALYATGNYSALGADEAAIKQALEDRLLTLKGILKHYQGLAVKQCATSKTAKVLSNNVPGLTIDDAQWAELKDIMKEVMIINVTINKKGASATTP